MGPHFGTFFGPKEVYCLATQVLHTDDVGDNHGSGVDSVLNDNIVVVE